MTLTPVAERSRFLVVLALLFFGGASAHIWFVALTFDGGVAGYLENADTTRSPLLLLLAATVGPVMLAASLYRMAQRRKPPVYLEQTVLYSEAWKNPLDMRMVERIRVDQAGCVGPRLSYTVFHLSDGSERRLPIVFFKESASSIAADLGERFGLPVEDPTISQLPLS